MKQINAHTGRMTGYTYAIFFCFSVICASVQAEEPSYFTPEKVYQFATYLYEEGDYLRAAGEFQRYLFCFDSLPQNADSIFYRVGICYRLGGEFSKAITYFQNLANNSIHTPLIDRSYYQIGLSYFSMKDYGKSSEFLHFHLPRIGQGQDSVKLKMKQLIALDYICQKRWDDATNFLIKANRNDSTSILLMDFATEGQKLPYKSKFLAGLFSFIVPGVGKIYCNRHWDGLFSLLTIGFSTWQSYEGFYKDGSNSFKGWLFGSISGVLYLGNIYGSTVAAQIYNEEQEEKLLNKVRVSINVNFQ